VGRLAAVIATVGAGALIALQPPLNSELGRRTTVLGAAFISATIAAVVLGIGAAAVGEFGQVKRLPRIPLIYLSGGLLSAILVAVVLVTVRTLGAAGAAAAMVTGQLIVSAILDRFGLLGLDEVGLTPLRLGGLALLLIGTAMMTAR
jgi:transporter family-2 protein